MAPTKTLKPKVYPIIIPVIDATKMATIKVIPKIVTVSYTHLRAHETKANLVCRLLLEKKK